MITQCNAAKIESVPLKFSFFGWSSGIGITHGDSTQATRADEDVNGRGIDIFGGKQHLVTKAGQPLALRNTIRQTGVAGA